MKKLIYILLLFPWVAHAAPGDQLFVKSDVAHLHSGPGEAEIAVLKLKKNHELVEIETLGNWVHVAVPGTEGAEGWIMAVHVATTRQLAIPADADDPVFETFRLEVFILNDMVKEEVVRGLYLDIQNLGDGLVEVTISNTWLNFTPDERADNLKYLMYLWERLHKGGTPLTIQLVDARGQKLMKTSLNRR